MKFAGNRRSILNSDYGIAIVSRPLIFIVHSFTNLLPQACASRLLFFPALALPGIV